MNIRKITIGIFLFTLLLNSGCTQNEEKEEVFLKKVKIMEVNPGLVDDINITGQVEANEKSTIKSEFKTNVEEVYKKTGDKVKKGDIIIKLSSENIEENYKSSQNSLSNALNSVSLTENSNNQAIKSAKTALETAKINLENTTKTNESLKKQAEEIFNSAKLGSELSISSMQTNLETAEKNLEETKESNEKSLESANVNLSNTIRSSKSTIFSALNTTDKILGISEVYEDINNGYENNLGALNTNTKVNSQDLFRKTYVLYQGFKEDYEFILNLAKSTENLLQNTLDMLNNSSTGPNYSQTDLNNDISNINSQLSSIKTLIGNLNYYKSNLDQVITGNETKIINATQSVKSAKKALEQVKQSSGGNSQSIITAKASYEATIKQLESNKIQAERQVESALNNYNQALKSAGLQKVGAISSYTSIEGGYKQSEINLEKLIIKAPFDGEVSEIFVKKGDEILPNSNIVTISNPESLKIIGYLSSNEINKIKIGDKIKIGKKSEDFISSISPSADEITKKFKIEIIHKNPFLKPGQFVNLKINTNNIFINEKRIFIPVTAIMITGNETFTWVIEEKEGKYFTKKTILGIGEIEGDKAEIVSGLEIGEKIIIEGGRILEKSGEEVEIELAK